MSKEQTMEFPETFEKFAKEYGFKDDKEIYTNGSDLIPIFRVKQWLEHDNKLRTIETDTAYECGKHANNWIPVSERLPEKNGIYVVWTSKGFGDHLSTSYYSTEDGWTIEVCAWKENVEPYKAESEDKE